VAERPEELARDVEGLLGPNDLVARLERWVADARADGAVAERTRERWLRQVADESATYAGVLVDLAERGTPVAVHTAGGRRHRGVVAGVGTDFVALRAASGHDVLLAFSGIAAVRVDGGGAPVGDRVVDVEMGLAEALAAIAGARPRVLVVTSADGEGLAGELRAVGRDVVTLRLDGADRSPAYVAIASIAEVTLA
jgi:hypothetical protein